MPISSEPPDAMPMLTKVGGPSGSAAGARLVVAVFLSTAVARAQTVETVPKLPPTSVHYLQYGGAIVGETVAAPGIICPENASAPCILASGGGLAIRVGYRSRTPWYVGGAYEFSRHESANLLRLAILQQLRFELRYYADQGTLLTPYAALGLGATVYGSEWAASTGGFVGSAGAGAEFQISESAVIGAALLYRPLALFAWTDSAHQRRADGDLSLGLAHIVGLELILELRDALPRWE